MPLHTPRRVQVVVSVVTVAILAAACSQSASVPKPKPNPAAESVSQPLPVVVNDVPLLELAKHALGAAEAYSVSKPVSVRVALVSCSAISKKATNRSWRG